jgi:predicted nucleic acid-binding protein
VRVRLLDTGPLVAYLDSSDPKHAPVAEALEAWSGRTATTSAVVTEAMHFLSGLRGGPRALADLLAAARTEVHDFSAPRDLTLVVDLMERYHDVPMDFADATLVLLAEGLGAGEIVTLDRRGFSTYRLPSGRLLRLVPTS